MQIKKGSLLERAYLEKGFEDIKGKMNPKIVMERHRHRYEVNEEYKKS